MEHGPTDVPMKRRWVGFEAFEREVSDALEHSIGHMAMSTETDFDAKDGLDCLTAYETTKTLPAGALVDIPEFTDRGDPSTDDVQPSVIHFGNGD